MFVWQRLGEMPHPHDFTHFLMTVEIVIKNVVIHNNHDVYCNGSITFWTYRAALDVLDLKMCICLHRQIKEKKHCQQSYWIFGHTYVRTRVAWYQFWTCLGCCLKCLRLICVIKLFSFFFWQIMIYLLIVFKGNEADNQSERKISHITFKHQLDGEKTV